LSLRISDVRIVIRLDGESSPAVLGWSNRLMTDDLTDMIRKALLDHIECHQKVVDDHVGRIVEIAKHLAGVLRRSGTVWICGNGGSAADAAHVATELVGRFRREREGWRVITLGTNVQLLTALANDFGYDKAFARELKALARPGDVLVAVSTSGASANILEAMGAAREAGLDTIAVTGRDGGELAEQADLVFHAPSDETPRIQEAHATFWHIICGLLEDALMVPNTPDAD
jgi:D-sedoheptulose 7-phosphate isomerase